MRSVDWDEVRERTIALYARRGAGSGPPDALSEKQVRDAEAQFGVVFPDDYRQYLLRVSAGGGRMRTLRFDGSRWDWNGALPSAHTRMHVDFPDHDTAQAASDEVWDRQPQPGDYASDAAYQADHFVWREAADASEEDRATGVVCLTDDGCGFQTLLVVSGPMRGAMWFDGRAVTESLNPLLNDDGQAATFAEWYLDWLAHAEVITTREQYLAAHTNWDAGARKPIWFRWFGS
ncbi:SMI1/KNR4 family protein [Kitasatospora sp. NPDC008115]|uniref:SMI1/KNR4 family protein n=1 Tax=Kitasatospora sp. NPDC008115 TaxID=3364022 RepID=UPI0036E96601